MAQKITLIEYDDGIYAGDDAEPDIQYRDVHPCVSGNNKIPEDVQAEVDYVEVARRIEDMRVYAYVISSSSSAAAEALFEHYSDELPITDYAVPTSRGIYYGDLVYQTFTPQVSHTLTRVRLYLRKNDIANDNDLFWVCQIFATTDGQPSGSALISKIIYNQSTPFDWQWVDFEFDSQITLTAQTMYAIKFYMTPGGSEDPINWARRGSDVYSRGQIWHWIWRSYPETPIYPGELEDGASEGDLFFEEWGYEL
jgi:hypothetical protein